MSFPIRTIDLPCSLLLPVGGSMHHRPIGEFSQGSWSPFPRATGIRQKLWAATVTPLEFGKGRLGDRRFEFEAFIDRLDGTSVAFRLWDPWRVYPRGMGAGIWNPRNNSRKMSIGQYHIDEIYHIDGAYHIEGGSTFAYVGESAKRYANSIMMTGLAVNSTVFKVGDDFEVGGNLYRVMDEAVSDANGNARVFFSWKLWKPVVEGDRINLHKPCGRFVLTDAEQGIIQRSYWSGETSFQAIEVPVCE